MDALVKQHSTTSHGDNQDGGEINKEIFVTVPQKGVITVSRSLQQRLVLWLSRVAGVTNKQLVSTHVTRREFPRTSSTTLAGNKLVMTCRFTAPLDPGRVIVPPSPAMDTGAKKNMELFLFLPPPVTMPLKELTWL